MKQNLYAAHNEWATRPQDQRFQTLGALRQSVDSRRCRAKQLNVPLGNVTAKVVAARDGVGSTIAFNGGVTPAEPTHWGFGQLCRQISAPAAYVRSLPAELAVSCLNEGIRRNGAETVKLMSTVDELGQLNRLNAVTSTTYGRIWDVEVVDAVGKIVEKTGGRFYNPLAYANGKFGAPPVPSGLYASDHDVFMFMIDGGSLLDAGPRAQINRGFIVWNSEVGAATLGIMTFLFNKVCGNNIIWGAQDVNTKLIRHNSGAPGRFADEAQPHLLQYVNASAAPIENTVRKANEIKVLPLVTESTKMDDKWVAGFAKKFKFTKGEVVEAIAYASREEGKVETLWDMVQGFTAAAREYAHIDARIDLEQRAGSLLKLSAAE